METRDVAICANRVSWGSLFSGVLTAFSISLLLALLGSALGFSMVDPWALSLLLAVIISGFIISGALRLAGNMLGAAGSAAGNIVTAVGNNSDELAGALNNGLGKLTLDDSLPADASPKNITDALQNSEVEALHLDYLQRQLKEIRAEVSQAVAEAMRAPERSEQIMAGLAERLK
ncbi:hypothetical protein [Candidatus Sodalis pierantonius]|uniref:hypothetical protein n=1 Tax=Candidatus Sodalis pierantonii TaxID=1486991 RepID=UPI00046CAB03|nr:hypothetical protein [Candidatus Sodalis pierantonius]